MPGVDPVEAGWLKVSKSDAADEDHGINTTAMAATIIAGAITEGDDTWRRFVPFELVWAGGALGRAAAQVHYWWFRRNERSKARQAREREAEFGRGKR